jgi:hypothetical protein
MKLEIPYKYRLVQSYKICQGSNNLTNNTIKMGGYLKAGKQHLNNVANFHRHRQQCQYVQNKMHGH